MMTIPSQFASWLALAARDGEGGLAAEPPAITRGEALSLRLNLPTHPEFEDWTGGVFSAVLRASPGAPGDPLASYECSIGTPASGVTPIALLLTVDAQADLPDGNSANGLSEVFLAVRFTPAGGLAETIISTRQMVKERV